MLPKIANRMKAKSSKKEEQQFNDVMLDLETLGNLPGCVILSIGAVEFNSSTGEIGREFYQLIKIQSCLDAGLFVQGDTIEFWMKQKDDAREIITSKLAKPLEMVLNSFASWFQNKSEQRKIWGNGLGFDISILKMAYHALGMEHPWKYDKERDLRTIVDFAPSLKFVTKFEGIRHEPISDSKHQIKYLVAILKEVIK